MLGWLKILRSDGSVLRARGMQAVAELIVDGLVDRDDWLADDERAYAVGEISGMAWAFALRGASGSPYDSYEVLDGD